MAAILTISCAWNWIQKNIDSISVYVTTSVVHTHTSECAFENYHRIHGKGEEHQLLIRWNYRKEEQCMM